MLPTQRKTWNALIEWDCFHRFSVTMLLYTIVKHIAKKQLMRNTSIYL